MVAMKVFVVVALSVLCGVSSAHPKWHELNGYTFEKYVKDFGKRYSSNEYSQRRELFNKKLGEVRLHNEGGHSWKKGINHMSDWTEEEFHKTLGGRSVEMQHVVEEHRARGLVNDHKISSSNLPLPRSSDWRNSRPAVISSVKNQGNCGSCWAHGATEQLESYWAMATGDLFVLSTQETTACTGNPNECGGTGGCNGATAELGYERAILSSITEEWQYPYTAFWGQTGTCAVPTKATKDIAVTGYTKVKVNDQGSVMDALAFTGPLAVNVDASKWSDYETGVFAGCDYSANITIDHVVQAVGYGTDPDSGLGYFLIRNSWSPNWGESGYIRLLRRETEECGWCVKPQDGTGCKSGPSRVWTCGMCGVLYDTSYPIMRPN